MSKQSMVQQEKKWQRQDDANALARAVEIQSDPGRLKAATQEAKSMLKEQQEKNKGLAVVAGANQQPASLPSRKQLLGGKKK